MKIKRILSRNRRDFQAIYVCEHCHFEKEQYGYDDANFHENVIPSWLCENCGRSAPVEYVPRQPKYAEDEIV